MTLHMTNVQSISDLFANPPARQYKGIRTQSQYLTMRDGTQIAVDVLLPADLQAGTSVPVVLIMSRYWRSFVLRIPDPPNKAPIGPREPLADDLVPRGFAMIVVDARGSGASMGISLYPWWPEEIADYAEVARWATQQDWCNGHVGAVGISYEGTTTQLLASTGLKSVKGVVPQEFEFDVYPDIALPGGIFNHAFISAWSESNLLLDRNKLSKLFPWTARLFVKGLRPVDSDRKSRQMLTQALQEHQGNTNVYEATSQMTYRDDPFGSTGVTFDDFSVFTQQKAIEASGSALFVWGSWMDGTTADTVIRTFNTFSNPQIGVIGAWKHEMSAHGSPYQKPKSKPDPLLKDQWSAIAQFFETTLKDDKPLPSKTLFYYTLGSEIWSQTDTFPLPNTDIQTWYFQRDHALSRQRPTDETAFDNYTVDFETTTGQKNRWHTQMARPVVYTDRAQEDKRLLTYTSMPLEQDMQVTGYPVVTLQIASSEADGGFYVYLEDVDEKGIVRYITEGQLRGLHRKLSAEAAPYWTGAPYHTFKRADASPLPKGEIVELTFGLQPTSVLFRRGHRIRVAIAGADKDTFARIPHQGTPAWQISRSQTLASCIRLPVVP